MSFTHRATTTAALAALALGLSACGSDDAQPEETTTTTTTSSAEPTEESSGEKTTSSDDDAESTQGDGGGLDVTVAGDQGVLALQRSGPAPDGAAGPQGGKLITGPGGCFALTDDGPPQLLVFPDDATFVLEEGKPSATVGGSRTAVGEQLTAETTEVPVSEVTGIPQRCSHGPSDTVLVVG